jgi:hypothetical protein
LLRAASSFELILRKKFGISVSLQWLLWVFARDIL